MKVSSYRALWFRVTRQQSCHASSAHELVTVFNANAKQLEEMGRRVGYTRASIHFDAATTRELWFTMKHLPEVERYRILLLRWMRLVLTSRRNEMHHRDAMMIAESFARALGVEIGSSNRWLVDTHDVDRMIGLISAWNKDHGDWMSAR